MNQMELNWEYLSLSGFVLYADTHRTEAHLSSHCDIVAETKCVLWALEWDVNKA